ncbi:1,2-dihydroxy-3-keto-5-methylthiopentene dioxygenase [Nonomuraea cavernae]|uniref:1,2-dihydroxy-3-keto-5-methylthiopentene dioxygenase n=1 Tax=Nonomuraea cavernae TaxID=2045107 RepID=UPI00340FC1B9
MSLLQIMTEDGDVLVRTSEPTRIAAELAGRGVAFERWELRESGDPLTAYTEEIAALRQTGGYRLVDVVHLDADEVDPDTARAARAKFLDEHVHDEDEVRFFADGSGCFYLHLGDRVYAVVCEAGDLLSVPSGTRHWFDTGATPRFTAVRFFQEEDGWLADFTGDPIARRIPTLDELLEATP